MASKLYHDLRRNIAYIRKLYIPTSFSPTGQYVQKWHERARAYRVLCHAEIEGYFEEMCKITVRNAIDKYKNQGKVSLPVIGLVCFCGYDLGATPKDNNAPDSQKLILEKVNRASTSYFDMLSKNHGIKEKNVLSMLLPLGADPGQLSPDLLSALNNYGAGRGKIAHRSRAMNHQLDPRDEWHSVKDLLEKLRVIDALFNKLTS